MRSDPFAELGLPALCELTDDDVRAAWRRIAAATHPDREDGGDPARFGAAAAAYALLRTPFGRGEALADLDGSAPAGRSPRGRRAKHPRRHLNMRDLWAVRHLREARHSREARHPREARRPGEPREPRVPRVPRVPREPWRLLDPQRLWDPRGLRAARRSREPQRRGAHRLHAAAAAGARPRAAPPARYRHAMDARHRQSGYAGLLRAAYARFRPAGFARYQHAVIGGVDRGLALPAGGAMLGAAAAIAAVGWTPATIGLVAGALTVTAWGLWRRAGRGR